MTSAAPPPTDAARFLADLRASKILSDDQITKATADLPTDNASRFAAALVAGGYLTRFQADRLLAGRFLGFHLGPYVLLEQVGKGSMGRVYRARHQTMNRDVAIKVLPATLTQTDTAKQEFQREIRAAAKLNHPNIVTAYDANEVGDRFYLVLEYVDGPTLETLVKSRGPLPIVEACGYVRQIAAGLQHAHEQGIVHRDIKPANLMVTRAGGEVKITDFGIAQLGKPSTPDARTDLHSLGSVFHFLLTGRPPSDAAVDQLRPDVSSDVAEIVRTLLAKRLATATELIAKLDAAMWEESMSGFDIPRLDSGSYSFSGSGVHPELLDSSPWENLTDSSEAETLITDSANTPLTTRIRGEKSPRALGIALAVASVVLLVTLLLVRALR